MVRLHSRRGCRLRPSRRCAAGLVAALRRWCRAAAAPRTAGQRWQAHCPSAPSGPCPPYSMAKQPGLASSTAYMAQQIALRCRGLARPTSDMLDIAIRRHHLSSSVSQEADSILHSVRQLQGCLRTSSAPTPPTPPVQCPRTRVGAARWPTEAGSRPAAPPLTAAPAAAACPPHFRCCARRRRHCQRPLPGSVSGRCCHVALCRSLRPPQDLRHRRAVLSMSPLTHGRRLRPGQRRPARPAVAAAAPPLAPRPRASARPPGRTPGFNTGIVVGITNACRQCSFRSHFERPCYASPKKCIVSPQRAHRGGAA